MIRRIVGIAHVDDFKEIQDEVVRYAVAILSPPCHHFVTTLSPFCHHPVTSLSPPCHQFVTTLSPPCHLCHHPVTILSPPCDHYVTTLSPFCHHAVTTLSPPCSPQTCISPADIIAALSVLHMGLLSCKVSTGVGSLIPCVLCNLSSISIMVCSFASVYWAVRTGCGLQGGVRSKGTALWQAAVAGAL